MAEIYNGGYALADPSSGLTAFSMECGEINMFGRCTLIRTTQRDSYPIINDAPIELEVKKESNLFDVIINGAIGISMGILLGACAVSIMVVGATTGGAALPFLIAAVPFMVASTAAICTTVGTIEKDLHTGYKRNSMKFFSDLSYSAMDAFTTGATIAEVLAVSTNIVSYMGACAVAEWGASFFTKDIVPAIISSGIGTTVIAEGAFAMSDANERITGYNWILDKVFCGNNELYEDSETFVDMLCESLIEFGGLLPDINTYSNNKGDMPDDGQAQKPSHTANTDGADREKAGNNKAAVSLEKAAEGTIGTGKSGTNNSSYNNYDTGQWGKSEPAIGAEQWGKDKQSLDLPEDKENTTDEVWYEEGVYIEPYCQSDNNIIDEEDEYADIRVTNADIDAYRKAKGIEKTLDPKKGIPLNTIAIGRTNVPGLENIDFVGRSSAVRKAMKDPTLDDDPDFKGRSIKAPYSGRGTWQMTRHAEEDLIAHFEKEIEKKGLKPEEIEGTLFIRQSNYDGVCSACTAGLPNISNSGKDGIFKQLTEKYPNLKIVATTDTRYGIPSGRSTVYFTLLNGKLLNWSKR